MLFSLQGFLNLRSQLSKNTIIGRRIVLPAFPLQHQRDVYQRHQRNGMLTLLTLISLRIGVITVGDEFGGLTVVFLIGAIDRHFDLLVVDVQSYM